MVVKVGTGAIADKTGAPEREQLRRLVRQLAALQRKGCEVLLVSSGAIGAGVAALGMKTRPTAVPDLQMCAAVGQARLMTSYEELFSAERVLIGQVLLTHDDFQYRLRYANAKRTMEHMICRKVIPIINENDVVADEEVKAALSLGDNDFLAALVVKLVRADMLIILSTVDGVLDATGHRVPYIDKVADAQKLVKPGKGLLSKGGMDSKLNAAGIAVKAGCGVIIADGRKPNILTSIMEGKDVGTLILSNVL